MNSEYANQNSYDCIQVHGGSGFMLEYACQRLYRDARITSIYEGTTQLQTVAAIRYVTNGTYMNVIREYEEIEVPEAYKSIKTRIHAMADACEAAVNKVKEAGNQDYHDLVARNLYEMTADVVMSLLLLRDTVEAPELFEKSLKVYVNLAEAEIAKHAAIVNNTNVEDIENYVQVAAKAEEE
jgi:acyl-coA dehydrogenase family protein